jgi:hypothetical protein
MAAAGRPTDPAQPGRHPWLPADPQLTGDLGDRPAAGAHQLHRVTLELGGELTPVPSLSVFHPDILRSREVSCLRGEVHCPASVSGTCPTRPPEVGERCPYTGNSGRSVGRSGSASSPSTMRPGRPGGPPSVAFTPPLHLPELACGTAWPASRVDRSSGRAQAGGRVAGFIPRRCNKRSAASRPLVTAPSTIGAAR